MFLRLTRFAVSGAFALACSSSDHNCNQMACVSETAPHITITGSAGGALPPGMYEVRVTTEAGASGITCDRTNPTSPASCTGGSPNLQVGDADTLDIAVSGDPKTIRVYVSKDGPEIAARSFTVKYEDREINGPGCGTCRIVTVTPEPKIELAP